ncbi:MAG: DUF2304 domain-containing protein [Deltaproteobacteria bacterium]|nr:DUF2304 domain-containing protein [Deltaproteobacteria bacterium]
MIPYKITTTIIGAIIFLIIFMLVRRGKLQEKYALAWFAIGISVVVLGLFPVIIDRIAWVTGITYPPALLFAIAVGVLLIQNLYLFILTSQNDVRIKELLQQVAVLNKLVDDLRTRDNPNPDHTTRTDSSPPRITPMK